MESKIGVTHPQLHPILTWLIQQHQDRSELEQRLRQSLGSHGFSDRHLAAMTMLDEDALRILVNHLSGVRKKAKALRALDLIAKTEVTGQFIIDEDRFEALIELANSRRYKNIKSEVVTKVVKEWIDSLSSSEELEDVLDWISTTDSKLAKHAKWNSILRNRILSAEFEYRSYLPNNIDKVVIRQILSGEELINEGKQMGHCLSNIDYAYSHAIKALRDDAIFFHLSMSNNEVMCATLCIEFNHEGWSIGDFETVGRGSPPKPLRETACELRRMVNGYYGFPDVEEDEEEFF